MDGAAGFPEEQVKVVGKGFKLTRIESRQMKRSPVDGESHWKDFEIILAGQGIDATVIWSGPELQVLMDALWKEATAVEKSLAKTWWKSNVRLQTVSAVSPRQVANGRYLAMANFRRNFEPVIPAFSKSPTVLQRLSNGNLARRKWLSSDLSTPSITRWSLRPGSDLRPSDALEQARAVSGNLARQSQFVEAIGKSQSTFGTRFWFAGLWLNLIEEEIEEAVQLFRQGAERGFPLAQQRLGKSLECGTRGTPKDPIESARWFLRAAEQGDAEAQFCLGKCIRDGRGVTENAEYAAGWLGEAARQGHPAAQRELGKLYEVGQGVEKNLEVARLWFTKAAEQCEPPQSQRWECTEEERRFVEALDALDEHKPRECREKALQLLSKNHEFAPAYLLLSALRNSCPSVFVQSDKTPAEALLTATQTRSDRADAFCQVLATKRGEGPSRQFIAGLWLDRIIASDRRLSFALYKRSAELGLSLAMCGVARCLENGLGVKRDSVEAMRWYTSAAGLGDAEAQFRLGLMVSLRDPVAQFGWLKAAAIQGHARACAVLGRCLWRGSGVTRNREEAARWYEAARANGMKIENGN